MQIDITSFCHFSIYALSTKLFPQIVFDITCSHIFESITDTACNIFFRRNVNFVSKNCSFCCGTFFSRTVCMHGVL